MTTLEQMAKAAYECLLHGFSSELDEADSWEELSQDRRDTWRAAIRAALAAVPPDAAALLSYESKPAEVKPDAVTGGPTPADKEYWIGKAKDTPDVISRPLA